MLRTNKSLTTDLHKAVTDLTGTLSELTGNTFYVPTLEEAQKITTEASKEVPEHDCSLSPEDGCAVCSEYLPDYIPGEEEEEEEITRFSNSSVSNFGRAGHIDDDPWAEFDEREIDGLNGEEEHLAKLTLLQGEEDAKIL